MGVSFRPFEGFILDVYASRRLPTRLVAKRCRRPSSLEAIRVNDLLGVNSSTWPCARTGASVRTALASFFLLLAHVEHELHIRLGAARA